jgi:hypothetical protein
MGRAYGVRYPTPEEAVAARAVVTPSGCWEWTGATREGYGRMKVDGVLVDVHRWTYERFIGPIPDGLVLDHVVCSNPPCCNPWHVEPSTSGENSWRERRTVEECQRGHARAEHTRYRPNGTVLYCLACVYEARRLARVGVDTSQADTVRSSLGTTDNNNRRSRP